jgi:hypothetical protein
VDDTVKDKGRWVEVDASLYEPNAQGVVVLAYAAKHNPQAAEAFYRSFFPRARPIFSKIRLSSSFLEAKQEKMTYDLTPPAFFKTATVRRSC